MKKIAVLIIAILITNIVFAQEKVQIVFNFNFINSNKGYTYDTKLVLEKDGVYYGESSVKDQEVQNEVSFNIPKGYANIKATLYAFYNGKWEARTEENGYSFDCVYEKNSKWNQNTIITLTVDIAENEMFSKEKFNNQKKSNNYSNSNNSYRSELALINRYLSNFNDGYYGQLEINDGYLYDNYASGEHSKINIDDIHSITATSSNKTVSIYCKPKFNCVYSTYTNKYHDNMPFSNDESFNTQELIDMFNNLISAYKNNSPKTNSNNTLNYKTALENVNNYLKTFDNGYYGYLEIKDGYLYDRYKSGKYSKALISNFDKAIEVETNKKVKLICKDKEACVYSTYTNSYHEQMSFSQNNSFNTQELIKLLNDLIESYNNP